MDIKNYAIKLVAVSLLFTLIEILEPTNKMKSITKTITAVVFAFVIISPIMPYLTNFNSDFTLDTKEYEPVLGIINNINEYQINSLKKQIEKTLQDQEIGCEDIIIEWDLNKTTITKNDIKKITVILDKKVILSSEENILINKTKEVLVSTLQIPSEVINVTIA